MTNQTKILDAIGKYPTGILKIMRRAELPRRYTRRVLEELIEMGQIYQLPDGKFGRKTPPPAPALPPANPAPANYVTIHANPPAAPTGAPDPAAVIRAAATPPVPDPNHRDDELVEEVKVPTWLHLALQTNRSQLVRVGAPKQLDEVDTWAVLNLVRVLMDTNDSLRRRLARANRRIQWASHHIIQADKATTKARTGHRDALNVLSPGTEPPDENPQIETD